MTVYNDNIMCHLSDILNLSVYARCSQLSLLFERCDLRDLTEVFPIIVKSIFGSDTNTIGWGLRTTTKENASQSFTAIYEFLDPLGPMFRACYRLLNEGIKFDFELVSLPRKMISLMQNGPSALFYGDLVNIDPLHRTVISLSLNAFDYYILHFVRHATLPLHRLSPIALQVHNELLKSVYFFLTASYLNTFLPGNPDVPILPSNISLKMKMPQPLPVQQLQPKRSPKYLRVPSNFLYSPSDSSTSLTTTAGVLSPIECNVDSPKASYWRTESVLNFFLDTWFRLDVDEARDLPSTDFIRVARILVKQVHSFGNSSYMDNTTMKTIRKMSQTMMRFRVYPFIKSLISRWPLDDSLAVVLELWFSYIQPWRYSYEILNNSIPGMDIPITKRYETFIVENLPVYTQIFIDVMARFGRLDFTSMSNVNMFYRLAKVFGQSVLPQILQQAEAAQLDQYSNESPQRQSTMIRTSLSELSPYSNTFSEWESIGPFESTYVYLFSHEKTIEIQQFIRSVYISRLYVMDEISKIKNEVDKIHKTYSLLKQLLVLLIKEELPLEKQLKQLLKIPFLLENSIKALTMTFNIDMPNISATQLENILNEEQKSMSSLPENRSYNSLAAVKMGSNFDKIMNHIDPALIPIQSHECTFLVKMLHDFSNKINQRFGTKLELFWNRADWIGKISRQILYPPVTTQWFDKPRGVTELFSDELPARICLRPLASYRFIILLGIALSAGKLFFGSSLLGIIYFITGICLYIFILAIFN